MKSPHAPHDAAGYTAVSLHEFPVRPFENQRGKMVFSESAMVRYMWMTCDGNTCGQGGEVMTATTVLRSAQLCFRSHRSRVHSTREGYRKFRHEGP